MEHSSGALPVGRQGFADIAKTFSLKELPESEIELSGEVPFSAVTDYQTHALAHIAEHADIPGFRPGKVPHDLVLKKVGELSVLEEAVELFVKDFYPELITERAIDAVGRPDIRVTKLAKDNPIGLTIRATVYPSVTLPKKWKQLHETIALEPSLPATEEDVTQTLEALQKNKQAAAGEGAALPELNDEFAQSLGAFENLAQLKEQIQKGITEEKAQKARDARRGKLIEALLEGSTLAVPKIFVESELEKIFSQMREDVVRFGMTFEDYLAKVGKTEEDMRKEFRDQAARRAKLQLVLNKVATEESLAPDSTAVEAEMKHALEHFPDANPELVKIHIETVLKNELALKTLEGTLTNKPLAEAK
jgi:FKBP-type peptidyl-prolyl cis-trans isomerase (trigger factor)